MLNEHDVLKALGHVTEPDLKKDIVALGLVSDIVIDGKSVSFTVKTSNPALHSRRKMEEACIHQLEHFLGKEITVRPIIISLPAASEKNLAQKKTLRNVKNVIAIASGKGGVGKSTIAANIAVALSRLGCRTGLIDADIYGPSIPMMFDVVNQKPATTAAFGKHLIVPVENYGVKMLSIGFFANAGQAVPWRGPMASRALSQMISEGDWGELDYMLIDLPPGTGDIHLTLVQTVALSGSVIVSTPQPVALSDAKKAVDMFRLSSINVPVLGIIENMAWFTPDELPQNRYYIFGRDGAKHLAEDMNIPLLGQIPLVQGIRESGDVGRPVALQENTILAATFKEIAEKIRQLTE